MGLKKNFLNSLQIFRLYNYYLENTSAYVAVEKLRGEGVSMSYQQGRRLIDEVQTLLAGGSVTRQKGLSNVLGAVNRIKADQAKQTKVVPEQASLPEKSLTEVSTEQKLDRLFNELKETLGQYAQELVETKNRELVEAAKKSNFGGFVQSKLGSWLK